MALDPPLQQLAAAMAGGPPPPEGIAERRKAANDTFRLLARPRPDHVTVEDHTIAVDGGEITVRVLRPDGLPSPAPTLLYIHGGGWFQGDLDTAEIECDGLSWAVPCLVALVDYRLAPEHPFPTPLDDCVAAYQWLLAEHERLDVDVDRIGVAGGSAGGNLSAALCLVARDQGLPLPVFQMLDVPCLDLTLASPSVDAEGRPGGLDRGAIEEFREWYLQGKTAATHPRVSPLHEPDLSGLPPAVIYVCEHDPVRDDGERYLTRLHEAGVPAACMRVLAQFHGGWIIPITVTSGLMSELRATTVRRGLDGSLVPAL